MSTESSEKSRVCPVVLSASFSVLGFSFYLTLGSLVLTTTHPQKSRGKSLRRILSLSRVCVCVYVCVCVCASHAQFMVCPTGKPSFSAHTHKKSPSKKRAFGTGFRVKSLQITVGSANVLLFMSQYLSHTLLVLSIFLIC